VWGFADNETIEIAESVCEMAIECAYGSNNKYSFSPKFLIDFFFFFVVYFGLYSPPLQAELATVTADKLTSLRIATSQHTHQLTTLKHRHKEELQQLSDCMLKLQEINEDLSREAEEAGERVRELQDSVDRVSGFDCQE
jgi:hypothetical protein